MDEEQVAVGGAADTTIVFEAVACWKLLSVATYVITYVPACNEVGVQLNVLVTGGVNVAFRLLAVAPTGTPDAFSVIFAPTLGLLPVAVNDTGVPVWIVSGVVAGASVSV